MKVYKTNLINFSTKYSNINKKLEEFIVCHIAQSEEVRKSDSKSRFIIRQIFKALYNDITLLPDDIIYDYFNKIQNNNLEYNNVYFSSDFNGKYGNGKFNKIFLNIKNGKWQKKEYKLKDKNVFNFDIINDFLILLKDNDRFNDDYNFFDDMLNAFISKIGFYIADMTDNEVYNIYNEIYGHNL